MAVRAEALKLFLHAFATPVHVVELQNPHVGDLAAVTAIARLLRRDDTIRTVVLPLAAVRAIATVLGKPAGAPLRAAPGWFV